MNVIQTTLLSEWSGIRKELEFGKENHPFRLPSEDGGHHYGLLRSLSDQPLAPDRQFYNSLTPDTQFRTPLALKCTLSILFIPGFSSLWFQFTLPTTARVFPKTKAWRSYFLIKMPILDFLMLSGNTFHWPLTHHIPRHIEMFVCSFSFLRLYQIYT